MEDSVMVERLSFRTRNVLFVAALALVAFGAARLTIAAACQEGCAEARCWYWDGGCYWYAPQMSCPLGGDVWDDRPVGGTCTEYAPVTQLTQYLMPECQRVCVKDRSRATGCGNEDDEDAVELDQFNKHWCEVSQ
jgi:hypothetical protein